eukprot:TRINITY_DN4657_c0_g1_i1.p1 TRINITY_DN4657_c0_g1~~TRINITY_DN4657_c0_g1_i1.p1  ORF type:complete len:190 (+),score=58.55 TRINITY_DN4657_c0_g1_i1:196-765(+)
MEEPPQESYEELCLLLLQRAVEIVRKEQMWKRHSQQVVRSRQRGFIDAERYSHFLETRRMIEDEIRDIQADAEELKEGWSKTIFQDAHRKIRADLQKQAEEKKRQEEEEAKVIESIRQKEAAEKKAQELVEKEALAKRMQEQLLKEDESNKAKSRKKGAAETEQKSSQPAQPEPSTPTPTKANSKRKNA